MRFKERMLTTEISPEFIESYAELSGSRARKRVEAAANRLERSYAVVAEVEENSDFYHDEPGYTVRVIPKEDAERSEVQHGVQSVMHWIVMGEDDE